MNMQARVNGTSAPRARPASIASPEPGRGVLAKAKSTPNVFRTAKPPSGPKSPRTRVPQVQEVKGKPSKSNNPISCSILEDRALLKKGIAKPLTPLNRSTSLWNVKEKEGKKNTCPRKKPVLNRSTSLWNVEGSLEPRRPRAKVVSGAKPSRIPLATHSLRASTVDLANFDEVDRSLDEHLYENCEKAPIYENLKKDDAVIDRLMKEIDNERKVSPKKHDFDLVTEKINLDKRLEILMSQLDDDDEEEEQLNLKSLEKKHLTQSQEVLTKKEEPEVCIKDIRRNWERQIKVAQEDAAKTKTNVTNIPEKKTKEIKELVNFFNNRNSEGNNKEILWTKKEEKSGYVSDGNCSEDSGHISNENDLEPQEEKSLEKSERFLEEIIQDLDASLEKTIGVFHATPIVQRFDEEMNQRNDVANFKSVSSSSIDSWGSDRKKEENEEWKITLPDDFDEDSKSLSRRLTVENEQYRAQVKIGLAKQGKLK